MTTSKNRTRLAVALFLPLAAILLTLIACLPAPVGDPEKSKVDEKYIGAWLCEGAATELVVIQKWDDKTYLVHYFSVEQKDGKDVKTDTQLKAWLTTLGGEPFMTLQPMNMVQSPDKLWVVEHVAAKADSIDAQMVDPNSDPVKALGDKPTSAELEKLIAAHAKDGSIFMPANTFKRVTNDKVLEIYEKYNVK